MGRLWVATFHGSGVRRHLHAPVNLYVYTYLSVRSQARFMEFKIQNMVGSCDVKFPIRLEGLVVKHNQFSRSG